MSPDSQAVLVLLGALAVGYTGSRFVFWEAPVRLGVRLGFRHLFFAGIEYLFLGFLLGPSVFGWLTPEALAGLDSVLILGLSWIGLIFGMQLQGRILGKVQPAWFLLDVVGALLTLCLTLVAALLWLPRLVPPEYQSGVLPAAALLAAAASVTTPSCIGMIVKAEHPRGPVTQLLNFASSLGSLVGLVFLAVFFSFYHPTEVWGEATRFGLAWLVVTLLLAVGLAFLFHYLTRQRVHESELVLIALGITIFSGGLAWRLSLSPLVLSFVVGTVLANVPTFARGRIYKTLVAGEVPFYIVFLLLLGAKWKPQLSLVLWFLPAYLALRFIGRGLGAWLSVRFAPPGFPVPGSIGLALVPQGGMVLAMALSYEMTYKDPLAQALATLLILAVVVNLLVGPFLVRRALFAAGELERK